MTGLIADDVVAIKARLAEIERDKAAAFAKSDKATDMTFEDSPWTTSTPGPGEF